MQPIKLMKFWRQFTVLVQRNLRLILNDKLTMASLILQAPFMVLVIKWWSTGLLYLQPY